jgi:hypothetical protein
MRVKRLLRMADLFYLLASSEAEKVPESSKDLKTVLKNLEKLETYSARKKYAEKNLKHLSSGSSRIVYKAHDGTIIKMAKNDKGIAQNKAEANPKMTSKFLNEILGHAKNYSWIQTHFLEKISVKDFKEMTGLDFDDFGDSIRYGLKDVSGNTDKEKPESFGKVSKSKIYKELHDVGEKFKLMPGDLARISSWGTKDGRPILIDAGLTKDVFADFYEDSSS